MGNSGIFVNTHSALLPEMALLPESSNMVSADNNLLRRGRELIRDRLPKGWDVTVSRTLEPSIDAQLHIRGPDGRSAQIFVEVKRVLQPRGVADLAAQLGAYAVPALVVAPYLSAAVRERLAELEIGFLDLTGNVRISLSDPGLFIEASGASVDPNPTSRASRSLRGDKAGRVVRVLMDRREPPGVRQLAEAAGVDPGYVSRIVAVLDRQALVERSGRGRLVSVDWERLLRRWAVDSPLESRGSQTMWLDPRGLSALARRLEKYKARYATTGTMAVGHFAPVAPARLAVLYADDADGAARALELRPAERGGNVMLIEPNDEGVYAGSGIRERLRTVAVSQAAADLLTSPGRGPAEAESLIAWMRSNEEVWRG